MDRPVTLRPATPGDTAALTALIERSGLALRDGYTPDQAAALVRHVFGVDSQLIADGTYYAVEADGEIVACGGWSMRGTLFGGDRTKDGPDPLLDPATDAARIRAFFVAPERARQGLGRRLMEHCTDEARRAGFRRMELVATLPGEPLYRASGFASVERFELDLPGVRVPVVRMERGV